MSPVLTLYRGVTTALGPLIALYLGRRMRRGKEDPLRFRERQGHASRPRPPGPLVWVHAASIGEAVSMLALIDRLVSERPRLSVLVTTGTVTSARLLAGRLPAGRAVHQYVPVDRPLYVRRFLDHWQPDLGIWVESELWPNLVSAAHRRRVPLVLLNGRMSQQSFRTWQRLPGLVRPVLASFALCLAQDGVQAERFARLGAAGAYSVGDLKSAAAPLPCDVGEFERLAAAVAGRPLWLAASTHEGEEEAAAEAHRRLRAAHPGLLTIIVPRHPARAAAIARMLRDEGLAVTRRSSGEAIAAGTEIYLGDTLGELGLFYRLAGIAFIGGSLVKKGGHNPLEAALLDCAILHGPDMANCAGVARALATGGGALGVADAAALAEAVARLLADPAERAARAAAAARVAAENGAVLDRIMVRLAPWLDRLQPDAAQCA
jgi:3-deoxy-D-manno-octulosonic-acid transferase